MEAGEGKGPSSREFPEPEENQSIHGNDQLSRKSGSSEKSSILSSLSLKCVVKTRHFQLHLFSQTGRQSDQFLSLGNQEKGAI
jgi:hypothetical protein